MAAPRGAIFARNRFGHDAPCTGALWQVPARRLETAGRSQVALGAPLKRRATKRLHGGKLKKFLLIY